MKKLLTVLFALSLFSCTATSFASDTFSDKTEWQNSVCGTLFDHDFVSIVVDPSNGTTLSPNTNYFGPIEGPQTLAWGDIGSSGTHFFGLGGGGTIGVLSVEDNEDLIFTPDLEHGPVEGFCVQYADSGFVLSVYDQTNLVDTVTVAPGQSTSTAQATYFGWTNTDGLNVTSIQITPTNSNPSDTDFATIVDFDIAFGIGCPPSDTGYSLLDDLIVNVASIPPTGNSKDDKRISRALAALNDATDDSFWADDNHLSDNGGGFFNLLRKATRLLMMVNDPAATQALEDIQTLTATVVENEIAAATSAGGNPGTLTYAQLYQNAAGFYASFGYYHSATRLSKTAWQLARSSY